MSTRAINLNDVFNYDLAAVPTSIFDEKSGLRISTSKYILKRKHQVVVTNPPIGIRDAVVIGGCARICVLQWPSKWFINNIVLNVCHQHDKQLQRTHAIFDRYNASIEDATRSQRACVASREHKLTMNAPLPQQQVVLSVAKNKVQLIDLICEQLQKLDDERRKTSLVITGRYPVLMEVRSKTLVQIIDLNKTHEEADGIIPQQVMPLADVGCKSISVICDDTLCVCRGLLLAHYIAELESLSV